MFDTYFQNYVRVVNGRCNGRSDYTHLKNGTVTIRGQGEDGEFRRIIQIVDGEIEDNRLIQGGKVVHRVAYGRFESKLTPRGREVTRFRKGSGKAFHGKSRTRSSLFKRHGWCHSWYKQGRLVRQKFFFDGGTLAYDWRGGHAKGLEIRNPDGILKYRVTGELNASRWWHGRPLFDRPMDGGEDWHNNGWFKQSSVAFSVEEHGTLFGGLCQGSVVFAGQYENRQRTGRWILQGQEHYYEHGVAIPRKLFHTPPEKLNPVELLKISNAQLRMAMLAKARFNAKRLAECGRVVHRDGAMRLIDVKGLETRILRVQCPSTSSFYYIHVPKDSKQCEAARQWTFHVGAGVSNPIQFSQET